MAGIIDVTSTSLLEGGRFGLHYHLSQGLRVRAEGLPHLFCEVDHLHCRRRKGPTCPSLPRNACASRDGPQGPPPINGGRTHAVDGSRVCPRYLTSKLSQPAGDRQPGTR
jgi:hypothetical protein